MQGKLVIDDLHQEIEELQDQYPNLKEDELFVLWFQLAYLTDDENRAAQALCSVSGEEVGDRGSRKGSSGWTSSARASGGPL